MQEPENNDSPPEQPQLPAFLIEYNPETRDFRWKASGGIPQMELCGCLGLIQSMLYDEIKLAILEAQRQAQERAVQLPNGGVGPGRIIF